MAARDARDPWWVPVPVGLEPPAGEVRRVAMLAEVAGVDADPAVSATVRQAARWLEEAGYKVEEAAPPRLEEAARLFFTLVRTEEQGGHDEGHRARWATRRYGGRAHPPWRTRPSSTSKAT